MPVMINPFLVFCYTLLIINITVMTTAQQSGILLLLSLILDFITGILASWTEIKKNKTVSRDKNKYVIESAKLRFTGVKIGCYSMGILGAWGVETIFLLQKIPLGYIATKDLTLTTFVIGFFCIIEFYSIFFENIKRMGFDIIQKISEAWKLYKTIKNGFSDNGKN